MRTGMRNVRRRKEPNFSFSESDGLQAGDSIGNRQKFSETRIHADDIGNRFSASEALSIVRDDIGNSVGSGPTHLESGILISVEGKGRRRREHSQSARHAHSVGGVNPIVSGNQALLNMFPMDKGGADDSEDGLPSEKDSNPITGRNTEQTQSRRTNRLPSRTSTDGSDRWLKKLLELDDEDRLEPAQNADPKRKAAEARTALGEIFVKGGLMAAIGTEVVTDSNGRASVMVSFEDIDKSEGSELGKLFPRGSLPLLALNFLINKIVNKVPEERVRVTVDTRNS